MGKRLTFFTHESIEEPTGLGRSLPIAKELVKRGHQVNILALHPDFPSVNETHLLIDGVHVYYVGQKHVRKVGDQKFYFRGFKLLSVVIASTWSMLVKGLALKADTLYCFKPQPINGFAALMTKFLKRKPLLLDCDDYESGLNRLTNFQRHIFVLFEDNLPKFCEKVTYHSQFLKDRYLALGYPENKFIRIPNGMEADRFAHVDEQKVNSLRQDLGLKDKKVILYFGAISLKSGHAIDILLKAFALAKQQLPEATLLIVGGGEDIDTLKGSISPEAKEAVRFIGRVPPGEIPAYLALADVSVDPIKDEIVNYGRFPLKIVESLGMGVPVITSDIGDRKLILEEGRAGLLVKAGNVQDLADGFIRILKDDAKRELLSSQAKAISQKYHWSLLTDKLVRTVLN